MKFTSAICRLNREAIITEGGKKAAIARLETLNRGWREILPDDKLRELAMELLGSYALKAADGLQLAASLVWCGERPGRRMFVCADRKLVRIAQSIGFEVVELS